MEAADFDRHHQQESDPHRPHWPSRETLLKAAALTGVQLTEGILEDPNIVGRYSQTKAEIEKKLAHLLDQVTEASTEQTDDKQATDKQTADQQAEFSMEKLIARSMRRAKYRMRIQQATDSQQAADTQQTCDHHQASGNQAGDNPISDDQERLD